MYLTSLTLLVLFIILYMFVILGNMKAREAVAQYSSTDEYTVKPEVSRCLSFRSGFESLLLTECMYTGYVPIIE